MSRLETVDRLIVPQVTVFPVSSKPIQLTDTDFYIGVNLSAERIVQERDYNDKLTGLPPYIALMKLLQVFPRDMSGFLQKNLATGTEAGVAFATDVVLQAWNSAIGFCGLNKLSFNGGNEQQMKIAALNQMFPYTMVGTHFRATVGMAGSYWSHGMADNGPKAVLYEQTCNYFRDELEPSELLAYLFGTDYVAEQGMMNEFLTGLLEGCEFGQRSSDRTTAENARKDLMMLRFGIPLGLLRKVNGGLASEHPILREKTAMIEGVGRLCQNEFSDQLKYLYSIVFSRPESMGSFIRWVAHFGVSKKNSGFWIDPEMLADLKLPIVRAKEIRPNQLRV